MEYLCTRPHTFLTRVSRRNGFGVSLETGRIISLVVSLFIFYSTQVFAAVSINPSSGINYGEFKVNATSSAVTFTVTNKGSTPVQLININAFGEIVTTVNELGHSTTQGGTTDGLGNATTQGGGDFIVVTDGCSNVELGVLPSTSAHCKASVAFSPHSEGLKTSALVVNSNASDSPSVQVPLTGVGTVTASPKIEVSPTALNFGEVNVNNFSDSRVITVSNTGNAPLQLGSASLQSKDFMMSYDCSNQTLAPNSACTFIMNFQPTQEGDKADILYIPSNDPKNSQVSVSLTGKGLAWCQRYETGFYISPNPVDFGSALIGKELSIQQYVGSWARGCEAREITNIAFDTAQTEFSVKNKNCYNSHWGDSSYSSCSFTAVFLPQTEGVKQSSLTVTYNDGKTEIVNNITGAGIVNAQPAVTITPTSHDFGTATVHTYIYENSKTLVVKNTGNTNLIIPSPSFGGTDADSFYGWGCYSYDGSSYWINNGVLLKPGKECNIQTGFSPRSVGPKQTILNIVSEAPTVSVVLTGTGEGAVDCSDGNITIESIQSGPWATISTVNNGGDSQPYYYGNGYYTDSNAWKRLKYTDKPNYPTPNDVVRIKSGHTISGLPYATVKALCIEENGTLESSTSQSYMYYYPYLGIYATDTIENKGTIRGLNGTKESGVCNATNYWNIWSTQGCAQPGASLSLSVQGGNFHNEGIVLGGNGGSGSRYGAPGGGVYVSAQGVVNTDDIGFINAGRGGSLTGTTSGQAGDGGFVSVWGNDFLKSDGRGISAGAGGNCNSAATEAQMGGRGGGMRLNAAKTVELADGTFATGDGGKNCTPLGINGIKGGFNTDPSVLSISGANTKIEGGDVSIYGGDDWVMDLSGLKDKAITATGDITLAVGKGGAINLTGNSSKVLEANGQVNLFTDNLMTDNGVKLSDIISANSIIVAPAKLLRDVTVTAPQLLSGKEGTALTTTIKIANGSPVADTFLISVTNVAGWTLSRLPSSLEIPALGNVELELIIQLPNMAGEKDLISVTAISKADPTVKSMAQIQVATTLPNTQVSGDNPSNDSNISSSEVSFSPASCASLIASQCNNYGRTLRDAKIETNGILSGGYLAGTIENRGLISQVTIEAGATLRGGRLSGFVTNLGTIADVELRGGGIDGGTLAGNISNTSSVSSVLKDIQLEADTQLQGVELEGEITGNVQKPALLTNLKVRAGTRLKGVIIGDNVQLSENTSFGVGVRFRRVEDIPSTVDLTAILPKVTPSLCSEQTIQPESLDLTANVVTNGELITAVNALPDFENNKWVLQQDTENALIYLDIDSLRFAVQPKQLTRSDKAAQLYVGVGSSVEFATSGNLAISSQPALQAPCVLYEALQSLKLAQVTITEDGNIQVPISDSQKYYNARPDLAASTAKDDAEVGLFATTAPVFLIFADKEAKKRQQILYAAPVDRTALLTTATDVNLNASGILEFTVSGKHHRGQLDYIVTRGETANVDGKMSITEIDDQNGDKVKDVLLTYPNGDKQFLYIINP